jgi:hypothetical protein
MSSSDVGGLVCIGVLAGLLALVAYDTRSLRLVLLGAGILAVVLLLGLYAPFGPDVIRLIPVVVLASFWWFKPGRAKPVRQDDRPPALPAPAIPPDAGLKWADRHKASDGDAVSPG